MPFDCQRHLISREHAAKSAGSKDELVFRLCFVNPRTDPARVLRVIDTLSS